MPIFLLLLVLPAWSDDAVDITEPQIVAALNDLQQNIDAVTDAVTSCMDAGNEHGACLCASEELILDFNTVVARLFARFPELQAYDLVSFAMPNGSVVTQSLHGIKNQARTAPECDE